jgi:hypothetical protein
LDASHVTSNRNAFIGNSRAASTYSVLCCRKVTVGFFGEGHRNRARCPGIACVAGGNPRLPHPTGTWPRLPDGGAFFGAAGIGVNDSRHPRSALLRKDHPAFLPSSRRRFRRAFSLAHGRGRRRFKRGIVSHVAQRRADRKSATHRHVRQDFDSLRRFADAACPLALSDVHCQRGTRHRLFGRHCRNPWFDGPVIDLSDRRSDRLCW